MITWCNPLSQAVAGNEKDHAVAGPFSGALDGAKLMLFTNAITPSNTNVVADLTVPLYTGYAAQAVTWGPVVDLGGGTYGITSNLATFQPTGGTPNDVIQGWGLTDSTGATLLAAGTFAAPIPIASVFDACVFAVAIGFGGSLPGDVIQG